MCILDIFGFFNLNITYDLCFQSHYPVLLVKITYASQANVLGFISFGLHFITLICVSKCDFSISEHLYIYYASLIPHLHLQFFHLQGDRHAILFCVLQYANVFILSVSERVIFCVNASSAIFQLYHCENKFIISEMMIIVLHQHY